LHHSIAPFGPGLLYGPNMIQHFLSTIDLLRHDQLSAFPFLAGNWRGERSTALAELREIEIARDFLRPFVMSVPEMGRRSSVSIPARDPGPKSGPTIDFITEVLFPTIDEVSIACPAVVLQLLTSMERATQSGPASREWDVPAVSDRLIDWFSKIAVSELATEELLRQLFVVWMRLISGRKLLSDFVRLAQVCAVGIPGSAEFCENFRC
jgi:hypothetical protein